MSEPLRFAVIGCGALARGAHLPNIIRSPRLRLQVCCDTSATILAECQREFQPARTTTKWEEAVADPDVQAICLATTEKLRLPVVRAAAEHGKPIYVEKPIARSLAEAYEIGDVVRASGIPFCIGHNRRCAPALQTAHRVFRAHMAQPAPCPWRWEREPDRPPLAEDGVAGMAVRINDDWHSWKRWVFDPAQAPHGPLLFEMTHFTDVCNWLLAAEPVEVVALEAGMLNHGVVIRYATGELATISMSANGSFGYPKELYEVMGQGAVVAVDHLVEVRTAGIAGAPARQVFPLLNDRYPDLGPEGGLAGWLAKRRAACAEAERTGDPTRILCCEPDKGHARMLEAFADEIQGRGPVVCGIGDAIRATEISFAAIQSARERRAVTLEEVRGAG